MARYTLDSAALAALPRDATIQRALSQVANDILEDARRGTPVDTGRLRDSGFVDTDGTDHRIGFDAPYSAFVELGTDDTSAQPFLAPAALNNRGRLR